VKAGNMRERERDGHQSQRRNRVSLLWVNPALDILQQKCGRGTTAQFI